MSSDKTAQLTQAQKAQLEAELAELEGPRRAEMVDAIATARSFGDLSENFEYHAAKNEQGLLERRITILRDRIESAVLVDEDAAAASGAVAVGSKVEIADERGERMQVEISSVGGVSPESPLGPRAARRARSATRSRSRRRAASWRARVVSITR